MSVSRVVFAACALPALLLLWCVGGSAIASVVDRISTITDSTVPTLALGGDGRVLFIGSRKWPLHETMRLVPDSDGRLVAKGVDGTFALGAITSTSSGSGADRYTFEAEPGDVISFVTARSRVSWPTPTHAWPVLGGGRLWARHIYHRLRWTKACGASLELVWRDEEHLVRGAGWSEAYLDIAPRSRMRPMCDGAVVR